MSNFDNYVIEKMAEDIDRFAIDLMEKYHMHPLSASSVIIGRLMFINSQVGCLEDFNILLSSIGKREDIETDPFLH